MDAHKGAVLSGRWSYDGSALLTGRVPIFRHLKFCCYDNDDNNDLINWELKLYMVTLD